MKVVHKYDKVVVDFSNDLPVKQRPEKVPVRPVTEQVRPQTVPEPLSAKKQQKQRDLAKLDKMLNAEVSSALKAHSMLLQQALSN